MGRYRPEAKGLIENSLRLVKSATQAGKWQLGIAISPGWRLAVKRGGLGTRKLTTAPLLITRVSKRVGESQISERKRLSGIFTGLVAGVYFARLMGFRSGSRKARRQ